MVTFYKQQVMDMNTGEVIQAVTILPSLRDEDFLKVFPLFGKKVLEDLNLLNGELKFLVWLIAKTLDLPYQSDLWIPLTYDEVAKDIGTTDRSVKRYIKKLLKLGYIEQYKKRHLTFRLKPDFFYKGNLKKYKIACYEEEILKAQGGC